MLCVYSRRKCSSSSRSRYVIYQNANVWPFLGYILEIFSLCREVPSHTTLHMSFNCIHKHLQGSSVVPSIVSIKYTKSKMRFKFLIHSNVFTKHNWVQRIGILKLKIVYYFKLFYYFKNWNTKLKMEYKKFFYWKIRNSQYRANFSINNREIRILCINLNFFLDLLPSFIKNILKD